MSNHKLYMKPQDLVVLLKIISCGSKEWFHHTLAESLSISQSEVSASLNRSKYSGLIDSSKRLVNKLSLLDFIEYGVKYVFPQHPGQLVRGIPTAHSAEPLSSEIQSDEKFVWPYYKGNTRGQAIIPLYSSVPEAIQRDKTLYELLALVDAVRVGKVREQKIAMEFLRKIIQNAEQPVYKS